MQTNASVVARIFLKAGKFVRNAKPHRKRSVSQMGRNLTYAQRMIIMRKTKARVLKACPGIPDSPGIYFFTRAEDGFKYAYVGQSKSLLTRVAQHILGHDIIDNSIRKRGLFAEGKPFGYEINFLEFR